MKKTKEFLKNVLLILAVALIIAAVPTDEEAAIYEDTVRLHILANSDSEYDQALKLKIRDKVLLKYGEMLGTSEDKESAVENIQALKNDIKADVDSWIIELGADYRSEVEIGYEWYETRVYEDFTLPSGYYSSLRIMLGESEGQNWWCVMYPPLCLDIATANDDSSPVGYSEAESKLITSDGYAVKFKILELMSEALADFSKNG